MRDIYLELYSLGPTLFISSHTLNERQDTYFHLCFALAHAWVGNKENTKKILSLLNIKQCLPEEQSLLLEISFLLAYRDKNTEGARSLATKALSFDNHALLSREFLAQDAFYKKELRVAEEHYSKILEVAPNHNNTIANLSITLFRQKEYKKAFELIDNIQITHHRILSKLLLWLMRPFGRLLATIGLLVIFLSIQDNIYIYVGLLVFLAVFFVKLLPKNNLRKIGVISLELFITSVWGLSILLRSVFAP